MYLFASFSNTRMLIAICWTETLKLSTAKISLPCIGVKEVNFIIFARSLGIAGRILVRFAEMHLCAEVWMERAYPNS